MKTKHLFYSIFLMAIALTNSAQIKVTTGGKTSIGYVGTPPAKAQTHLVKNIVFSKTSSGTGAMIKGVDGVSAADKPDYTWYTDTTTGIFHSTSGLIQFTISGGEKFRFAGGQLLKSGTLPTSASAPDYSWVNDATTGMFNAGSNAIGFSTSGAEKMRIDASGNLGIGLTGPSARLDVAGSFKLNGWTDVNFDWSGSSGSPALYPETSWYLQLGKSTKFLGDAYITHEIYVVAPSAFSDSRLKRNINYELNTIDKLKLLKPAKYNFNDVLFTDMQQARKTKYTTTLEYGLIAQEVMAIFPELVDQDSATGYYSVKYTEFIPMLIDAVQKQQAQIETLQDDLNKCCTKKTTSPTINNRSTSNTQTEATNVSETSNWLAQNKPNPFNKETVIEYNVVQEGKGSILVFDMNGKLLKTIAIKIPGKGTVTITANDLPAGMYYYTLVVNDNEVDTKKMILTQ